MLVVEQGLAEAEEELSLSLWQKLCHRISPGLSWAGICLDGQIWGSGSSPQGPFSDHKMNYSAAETVLG